MSRHTVHIALEDNRGAYLIDRLLVHPVLGLHAPINHRPVGKNRRKAFILKRDRHIRKGLGELLKENIYILGGLGCIPMAQSRSFAHRPY